MVASSQAQRLKPHAIDVRSPMDPVHWFLDGKQDVRSFTPLQMGAPADPAAPAANVEPKFTGDEPGSYKGYFQMWLDLESRDAPAGGSIDGAERWLACRSRSLT